MLTDVRHVTRFFNAIKPRIGICRYLLSKISYRSFISVLVPELPSFYLGVQSYWQNNEGNFPLINVTVYLLPTFDMN